MANLQIEVNQNDKEFYIPFIVKNKNGSRFNLTGYTINFNVADEQYIPEFSGTCDITDAENGECRYFVVAGNLSNYGTFPSELELILGDKIITNVKKLSLVVSRECG